MSTLVVTSKAVAHSDSASSNDPRRKHFDWLRDRKFTVSNPKSNEEVIPAGGSFSFFNGTVATSIDGTTAFTITKSPLGGGRYRFTNSGGTAPAFRTTRGVAANGQNVTITDNGDGSATFTLGGSTWGTTVAGDSLWLPGPQTGDAATPFNVLNQGSWVIIAVLSATVIQAVRPSGIAFSVAGETVAVTANTQVQTFSAAGVQAGDKVDISAAFSPTTQRTFEIVEINPSWFEVLSTIAVPLEVGKIPTATGMVFYSDAKTYVCLETDQEIALRFNGATDDRLRISPSQPGVEEQTGWHEHTGPSWSLTVVNKSSQASNCHCSARLRNKCTQEQSL
jgi:hypothetical protein